MHHHHTPNALDALLLLTSPVWMALLAICLGFRIIGEELVRLVRGGGPS